jgi:O-antigen/teichoic acid export membrane protein
MLPRSGKAAGGPTTGEKVTGAISWTVVPRVIQIVGSIFTSILIVRSLGQFDYGTLSVLRSLLYGVVVIVGFGLGQGLNRFIPELRATGRMDEGRSLLYRSLALQSAVWVVASLALLALRPFLRQSFPTYADLLILGIGLSMAEVAAGTISQYAVSSYRTRQMAIASGAGTLALAVATVLLLHFGLRVSAVLIATALGHCANATTLGLMLRGGRRKQQAPAPPTPEPSATLAAGAGGRFSWRRMLAYSVPWIPNHILIYISWRQSETFLLGIFRTRVLAGFFDLAYKLPQLMLEFVPTSVYPLVLAGFAETATVARERMRDVITAYYWLLFFLTAPLSVLGLAMGDVLLTRMYGQAMAPAGHYCQAFFVIFTVSYFGTPLSMTVYVVEKVWVNLVFNLAYAIATLGLDLLLIPRYGLLGATIPTGIVTAITPWVRYVIARRYLPDIRIPWGFIGRAYLGSSPLLALFWIKRWVHGPFTLLLVLLGAAAVTVLSYRTFRVLGPQERAFVARTRIPLKGWVLKLL